MTPPASAASGGHSWVVVNVDPVVTYVPETWPVPYPSKSWSSVNVPEAGLVAVKMKAALLGGCGQPPSYAVTDVAEIDSPCNGASAPLGNGCVAEGWLDPRRAV